MPAAARDTFVRDRTALGVLAAGVLTASWVYAPYVDRGPVLCVLHGVVGLPCPACGLTHAFCDLAHGRLAAAAAHNAAGLPLFAFFLLAVPTAAAELILRRPFRWYRFLYSSRLAGLVGGLLAVYHIARTVVWSFDGRLFSEYFATSWTYRVWQMFP
jgi:hypothetical protein